MDIEDLARVKWWLIIELIAKSHIYYAEGEKEYLEKTINEVSDKIRRIVMNNAETIEDLAQIKWWLIYQTWNNMPKNDVEKMIFQDEIYEISDRIRDILKGANA
jgi:hypothetical protein